MYTLTTKSSTKTKSREILIEERPIDSNRTLRPVVNTKHYNISPKNVRKLDFNIPESLGDQLPAESIFIPHSRFEQQINFITSFSKTDEDCISAIASNEQSSFRTIIHGHVGYIDLVEA